MVVLAVDEARTDAIQARVLHSSDLMQGEQVLVNEQARLMQARLNIC